MLKFPLFEKFHSTFYEFIKQDKTRKYRRRFDEQLPDALDLLSNSMKAGLTLLQAINTLTEEMSEPISKEFKEVLNEQKLGVSFDESLIKLNNRVNSQDLDIFITSVLVTRQTGANISEILIRMANTIRERQRLSNQINVLTAQGRISGIIVGSLPVFLTIIIMFIDPTLVTPMFTTFIGLFLVFVAVILEIIGAFVIKKIITVDI